MTLPNFLVIGAYKSGTSSLQHYLRSHPEVFVPEYKEPRFFAFDTGADGAGPSADEIDRNPMYRGAIVDIEAYRQLFAEATTESAVGEVSPEYLKNPAAAPRIAARVPKAKLIAVLRNPVQRAFSDYLMYRRDGRETETDFLAALQAQPQRLAAGEATGQYLVTGHYADQLEVYYQTFDRSQILVVRHEDLVADRDGTMSTIFEFLDVDPGVSVAPEPNLNRSGVFTDPVSRGLYSARRRLAPLLRDVVPGSVKQRIDQRFEDRLSRPTLEADAEAWLYDYYRSQVSRTAELTGLDLGGWTSSAGNGGEQS
jgi:hypothetical protein